ncbi:MAG: hypothetical protein ACOZQL_39595 [Myxococcota bacterium]
MKRATIPFFLSVALSSQLASAEFGKETVVDDDPEPPREAAAPATISIPAEATAKTAGESNGGQAGVGFNYDFGTGYLRARINIAAAPFEVKNGKPADYGAMLLQPDLKGASVAVDAAGIYRTGSFFVAGGGGLRVSPQMTWKLETTTVDAMGVATTTVDSRDAMSLALMGGLFVGFDLPGPTPELRAAITLEVPLTLRALMGPVTADGDFLLRTLGDKNTVFLGAEPRVRVRVGDLGVFASFPMLATFNSGAVPGLTGVNVILGAEVRGDVVRWQVSTSTTPRDRARPPSPETTRARSAAQFSL